MRAGGVALSYRVLAIFKGDFVFIHSSFAAAACRIVKQHTVLVSDIIQILGMDAVFSGIIIAYSCSSGCCAISGSSESRMCLSRVERLRR